MIDTLVIHTCVLPGFTALGLSLLLTPLVRAFARSHGYLAKPSLDRWHQTPTALFGGIGIFLAFLMSYGLWAEHDRTFWGLILGCELMFFFGLIDDVLCAKPSTKLLGQIVAASVLPACGLMVPGLPPQFAIPLTVLWVVGLVNAFNLLDNMDGLSAGVAVIAASVMAAHAVMTDNLAVAMVAAILAGSALGFLRYNVHPASIFMGDAGSQLLGYVLAAVALLGVPGHATNLVATMMIPVLLLSVPIFDTLLVALARKLHCRPVSQGGTDHSSHRLVALGLSESRAVWVLYVISAIAGALVLLNTGFGSLTLLMMMLMFGVALLLFGMFLGEVRIYSPEEMEQARKGSRSNNVFLNGLILYKRRVAEVAIDTVIIYVAYLSSYLLRYEGVISEANAALIAESLPLVITIKLSCFFGLGLYRGVWRYVSLRDLVNVVRAVTIASGATVLALLFVTRFEGYSRAAFVIDWIVLVLLVSGVRVMLRVFQELFAGAATTEGSRILIVGAGDTGELVLRELRQHHRQTYQPVGFVDDDLSKHGRSIHGLPVLGGSEGLYDIVRRHRVQEVLVAIPSLSLERWDAIASMCRAQSITCRPTTSMVSVTYESVQSGGVI